MSPYRNSASSPFGQRGVTLVELMVALVLGLVVSGAALALFMTNKQVYTTSENLDRVQETSRTAFELMARDLREANGNPCSNDINPLSNGLKDYNVPGKNYWWSDWGAGIKGYTGTQAFPDDAFGTTALKRVAGTPAIEVWNAVPVDITLTAQMADTKAALTVTTTTGKVAANDILVICDYNHGAIFQATAVGGTSIAHAQSGTPGNATADLPPSVFGPSATKTDNYAYISKMHASRWYIGYNGRTDRSGTKLTSLYRTSFTGTGITPVPDEIAENVVGMTLTYHVTGTQTYVDPAVTPVADWNKVDAMQIGLNLASRDKVGTDKQTLKYDYSHVVAIRSRAP